MSKQTDARRVACWGALAVIGAIALTATPAYADPGRAHGFAGSARGPGGQPMRGWRSGTPDTNRGYARSPGQPLNAAPDAIEAPSPAAAMRHGPQAGASPVPSH